MTDIGLLVQSANPVPSGAEALTDDELESVLLLAMRRSTDMEVKDRRVPTEPPAPRVRGWMAAAAAFAVLIIVVGAVWLFGGGDVGEVPPATAPPPTSTTAPPTDDAAESTETTAADDSGGILTLQFAPIPEGMWRVESLGTAFDVDIEGDWWIQPNGQGWAVFTHPDSVGPGERDVVFIRPTALTDPTDPGAPEGEDWAVDDIEGWLAAIIDGVVVSAPADTEVGGAEGIVFEVETDSTAGFVTSPGGDKAFDPGFHYTVYWLDQGEHEPIAIVVGARTGDFADWIPTADSLLANVTFDEPAPYPSG